MGSADDLRVPCLISHFKDRSLDESLKHLCSVSDFLRASVVQFFASGIQISEGRHWASLLKRNRIVINRHGFSELLQDKDYDLGEVIDQCATLERLIDAIAWIKILILNAISCSRAIPLNPMTARRT